MVNLATLCLKETSLSGGCLGWAFYIAHPPYMIQLLPVAKLWYRHFPIAVIAQEVIVVESVQHSL